MILFDKVRVFWQQFIRAKEEGTDLPSFEAGDGGATIEDSHFVDSFTIKVKDELPDAMFEQQELRHHNDDGMPRTNIKLAENHSFFVHPHRCMSYQRTVLEQR